MPFGGLLTAGLIGGGASLFGGIFGASQASKAAQQQVAEQQQALQFQEGVYSDTQANQAPFVQAGQSSIQQLMAAIGAGKYGPGSTGAAPTFTTPTLADAQQTPGYAFTQQQGELGIERGAAAAGGAFTGGTLKSLASFDTGLADSTYNDVFSRALQGYGASMGTYQANLAAQAQGFNQLSAVAGLGENAAANLSNSGAQASTTVGNTLTNIGNAQAAGTVGSANSLIGGITGATNSATLPYYLQYLNQPQKGSGDAFGAVNWSAPNPSDTMKYSYTGPTGITSGLAGGG